MKSNVQPSVQQRHDMAMLRITIPDPKTVAQMRADEEDLERRKLEAGLVNLPPPVSGADKYHGEIAANYDTKREVTEKWKREQEIIEQWLSTFPAGTRVLDVPVGTGRFIPAYIKHGFEVTGVDASDDMLREARAKLTPTPNGSSVFLRIGDARQLDFPDKRFDVSVCCRLFRWLSPEDVAKVSVELQRVTTDCIIMVARVADHPHARPRELFLPGDGWAITEEEIEPNYIAFKLDRVWNALDDSLRADAAVDSSGC